MLAPLSSTRTIVESKVQLSGQFLDSACEGGGSRPSVRLPWCHLACQVPCRELRPDREGLPGRYVYSVQLSTRSASARSAQPGSSGESPRDDTSGSSVRSACSGYCGVQRDDRWCIVDLVGKHGRDGSRRYRCSIMSLRGCGRSSYVTVGRSISHG